ncbi:16S rRNA (cytidine(1402)-2'-O)-methyltransferase [Candidatus Pelagibacter sp.]|jgi:16S rRNA (cytidine1402-2'-O)-methyltransferase|nr:16S rRNA (cytidine(1402)-2'-O)-methyltransferase [Candidatus Pelagibacter sp.]|tara:strand:- start:203 stop:1066 length:864 start_codon:yes stop_codon:yes gene_type:complete
MIPQRDIKNNKLKHGLYVVSTPIGNLEDITLRAIEVLKQSEYILCEDTRVSKNLLEKYKIKSNLISNHKFNETKNLNKIIKIIKLKAIVSIISDAGTPCVSDPGSILINECVKNGINIYPIPGASAVTAAVSISGFSEKYYFYGFLPQKKKDLNKDMSILSKLNCSIVFFVSPKKINKFIEPIKFFFSGREMLICREISKFYEEYTRTPVNDLQNYLKPPKGELTIVISEAKINTDIKKKLDELDKKKIKKMIKISSIKDIVNLISKEKDISKKDIYNFCLKVKNEK